MIQTEKEQLTADQINSFIENGFLRLPAVLNKEELHAVRSEMDGLMESATPREDFSFSQGHRDGSQILRRIEYVIDKSPAARAMLGNPKMLSASEQIAGKDFFPTQDAMVLKMPGQGIAVPWHRDNASTDDYPAEVPVFIADFYLDEADDDTCLWVIPKSHRLSDSDTQERLKVLNHKGFSFEGASKVLMQPGDVLLHNVRLLHGSPPNESAKLRRTIYYTVHTVHVEWEYGPHTREYIIAKQKVLRAAIRFRQQMAFASSEKSFEYNPPAEWDKGVLGDNEELTTYRYSAKEHRSDRYKTNKH